MPITDVEKIKSATVGAYSSLAPDAVLGTFRRTYSESVINSVAGTAVTESVLEDVRRAGLIKSVALVAPIAVTADATNNATISVWKRTITAGVAGAATLIASGVTTVGGTGTLAAFVPVELVLTAANTSVGASDVLTFGIAKGGTGVALTAATSAVKISVDVEDA